MSRCRSKINSFKQFLEEINQHTIERNQLLDKYKCKRTKDGWKIGGREFSTLEIIRLTTQQLETLIKEQLEN